MIRRDFMAGILSACTAPAIVRAESIMVVRRPLVLDVNVWVDLSRTNGWRVTLDEVAQMWRVSVGMYKYRNPTQVWVRVPELDHPEILGPDCSRIYSRTGTWATVA